MGISQFASLRLSEPGLQQPSAGVTHHNSTWMDIPTVASSIHSVICRCLGLFNLWGGRYARTRPTTAKSRKGKPQLQHFAHSFSAARLFGFGRKFGDFVDPLPASETELLSTSKTWIYFQKRTRRNTPFWKQLPKRPLEKNVDWFLFCFLFRNKTSHNCINFWCFLRLTLSTTNHSNRLLHRLELRMDASHI